SAAAGMSGVGNGQFVLDIPLPFSKTHLSTLAGKGSLDASAVVAGAFAADSASAQLSLRDGVLRIDPITFHKADHDMNGQGGRAGQAVISIETQTADLLKPTVKLSAHNWPVRMGGEEGAGGCVAVVSADASLAVNASPNTPFTATDPRAIEPLRVTVGLTPISPVGAAPPAKFRTLDVGPAKLSAFVNLSPSFALRRIVMDELPSEARASIAREEEFDRRKIPPAERPLAWNDFRLAGGRIRLWGRRGQHAAGSGGAAGAGGAGGEIQTHITADLFRLDLDQLVHAFKTDADP